jgi:hypothetical protein
MTVLVAYVPLPEGRAALEKGIEIENVATSVWWWQMPTLADSEKTRPWAMCWTSSLKKNNWQIRVSTPSICSSFSARMR